jgi:hypothetical protein
MFTCDSALRNFAQHHLVAELNHLMQIKEWLPPEHFSQLLPAWHLAGFLHAYSN